MGNVLKQSSAAASSGASATWHAYADYYEALGFHASTREALLKHVRATSAIHLHLPLPLACINLESPTKHATLHVAHLTKIFLMLAPSDADQQLRWI